MASPSPINSIKAIKNEGLRLRWDANPGIFNGDNSLLRNRG
jgi:hypothetical protein